MRRLAWMAAGLLAGCATATPPPAPDVVVYLPPRDPAHEIPQHLKAPLREANERQMLEAIRFQQQGEALLVQMARDPRFGGLIFRHQPEPHAIVMFTGDAEARLRRYTTDPRFRARSVDLTLAELERQKSVMTAQLVRLGIHCFSVDGDEEHNAVTVGVPDPDAIRRAIADGRITPPAKLRLVETGCPQLY